MGSGRLGACAAGDGLAAKRVAEPVRGPDPERRRGPVAEGLPNLSDEVREIRLGDEGIRPEPGMEDLFALRRRTAQCEGGQQVEGFGREVHVATRPQELAGLEVQGEGTELNAHDALLAKT